METGVQNNLISGQLSVYKYLKIKNNFFFFYLNLTSMKMLQTIKSLNHHQIKFLQKNAKRKEKKSLHIATTPKNFPSSSVTCNCKIWQSASYIFVQKHVF